MNTLLYFFLSMLFGLALGYIILNGYLGSTLNSGLVYLINWHFFIHFNRYLFLIYISFIILLILFWSLNFIEIESIFNFKDEITKNMSSLDSHEAVLAHLHKSNEAIKTTLETSITDNAININNPNLQLSLPQHFIQQLTVTVSSAAGVSAGVWLAKEMPSIAGKAGAVIGVTALSLLANITGQIILNKVNKDIKEDYSILKKNLLNKNNTSELTSKTGEDKVFNTEEFPFNLLPEGYLNLELFFLILILKAFLSTIMKNSNFNYSKYIPDNKLSKKMTNLIQRYLNIWYNSKIFVFIVNWTCLLMPEYLKYVCVSPLLIILYPILAI